MARGKPKKVVISSPIYKPTPRSDEELLLTEVENIVRELIPDWGEQYVEIWANKILAKAKPIILKEMGEWLETQQLAEFFDVNDTSCVSFKKEVIEALKQGKCREIPPPL